MDERRLRALLEVGRSLVAELDPDAVLRRLLDVARDVTGARYAAVGVLDDRRERLERFLTAGIDSAGREAIGDLPDGRGVLGVLIREPRPLRLAEVGRHPLSYGFPHGHPPMRTFLGVPLLVGGQAWGNLYLTEKDEGEFTPEDEDAATIVADWAAIAISNARLYRDAQTRRAELERANRALETTTELSRSLGGVTDLPPLLELVVKRARAMLRARATVLGLLDGDEVLIATATGEEMDGVEGMRVPVAESLAAVALRTGRSHRIDDIPPGAPARRDRGRRRAVVAPMLFRGRPLGFVMGLDRVDDEGPFSPDDERLLAAFAASAATAVATAQSASDEALRRSLEAAESERGRWAREMHDQPLQELAAVGMLLASARGRDDPDRLAAAVDEAVELIKGTMAGVRALITDLRPPSLDELGAEAALEALAGRMSRTSGLEITLDLDLAYERGRASTRPPGEVESTIYRLVQEALTNVVKHAGARTASVTVAERDDRIEITVRDDGCGFDPARRTTGFGFIGMRERAEVARGRLEIDSAIGAGTVVSATIPAGRRGGARRDVPATG